VSDLLVTNVGECATLAGGVRRGAAMRDAAIQKDVAIVVVDGLVKEIGPTEKVARKWRGEVDLRINAGGRAVVPGFVDPHTHAVFADDRAHEYDLKLQGLSYGEILARGGGIHYTVERTRKASRAELLKQLLGRLDRALDHGTTTMEIKTGYGLDKDTELRLLEVVGDATERHVMDLVTTFMGAHAIPKDSGGQEAYADFVIDEVLPEAAEGAEFVDVFCEEGVFDVPTSRRILEAGRGLGLSVKVHADELARSGGSRLAAELHATSADHLLHATKEDIAGLVEADVVPVLLPGTAFNLGGGYADARQMIALGAPVALATDLNPNCWLESMPLVMSFACTAMRMTPAEALAACTINAAAALGREAEVGSIEPGKRADFVLLDAPSHAHLPYRLGGNLAWRVVKDGIVVVDRSDRR